MKFGVSMDRFDRKTFYEGLETRNAVMKVDAHFVRDFLVNVERFVGHFAVASLLNWQLQFAHFK